MSGWSDPYVDLSTGLLRNKLGIADPIALEKAEKRLVSIRHKEGLPEGDFDMAHLCAIHWHLFQDVYDWAGKLRTIELSKGDSHFLPFRFLDNGMRSIHDRLVALNFLRGLSADQFAEAASSIIGDLNYAHPFREGNGRTQLAYLKLLAKQAGHRLDLRRFKRAEWIPASRAAHAGDYAPMAACIRAAIVQSAL